MAAITQKNDVARSTAASTSLRRLDAELPFWWSVMALLSLFLLDRLGPIAVVGFLASTLVLLYPLRAHPFQILKGTSFLMALPLLTVASTFWSDNPLDSFRYGLQLVLTAICALTIATRLRSRDLAASILLSSFAICLASLVFRNKGADGSLLGMMNSKNSMASVGALLLIGGLQAALDVHQRLICRLLSPLAIVLALGILVVTHSAGAVLGAAVSVGVFLSFAFLSLFPPRGRAFIIAIAAMAAALMTYLWINGLTLHLDMVERALGKDATLTGRTYLWGRAMSYIAAKPVLGHGFCAFWTQGSVEAEGLWRYAGINTRAGFNFHNSYLETGVDLGWLGMILLGLSVAAAALATMVKSASRPSLPSAFLAALIAEIIARSFTETLLFRQLNYFSYLFIIGAAYSLKQTLQPADKWPPNARRPKGPRRNPPPIRLPNSPPRMSNGLKS